MNSIVKDISFKDNHMYLIVDNQMHEIALKKASRILDNQSIEKLSNYKISPSGYGLHWPELDEDLSIQALLKISKILANKL